MCNGKLGLEDVSVLWALGMYIWMGHSRGWASPLFECEGAEMGEL